MVTPKKKPEERLKLGQKKAVCDEHMINRAYELSACLMLDCQIMQSLDISRETFYKWKRVYPDFADSLNKGRAKTLENLKLKAIEKSNTDPLMMMFLLKNKGKYLERNQEEVISIKKKELKLKEKELVLKSEKFASELAEKFQLNKEEVLQILKKYQEK